MDTARQLSEKKQAGKKSKSPFGALLNRKDKNAPVAGKRARSVEYGQSEERRVNSFRIGKDKKKASSPQPNKSATLPLSKSKTSESMETEPDHTSSHGPVINIEAPRGIIPYEFQDAMGRRQQFGGRDFTGSEGSDPEQSEGDLQELMAVADTIDEYTYSVRIFPGQDPAQVYVGWVSPGFHFNEKLFDNKKTRHVVLSTMDDGYNIRQR